jgi:hypothetical protein
MVRNSSLEPSFILINLDKLNRTKILLLKASSLIKRNDNTLTPEIVKTLEEVHSALKNSDGQDDSM